MTQSHRAGRRSPHEPTAPGGPGRATALDPSVVAAIDGALAPYAVEGEPGAAVAVIRAGTPVLARGYGLARLPDEASDGDRGPVIATPETAFRLASLTKQLTAELVRQLVAEGRLALHTPLADLLPGFPSWAANVRLGHLVVHTSGIPEYEAMVPPDRPEPVSDREVAALLATAPALRFAPGTRFDYSNGGYALLATIVEEVAGRSFTELLDERVFRPLGMASSVAHVEGGTVVRRRALGYRRAGRAADGSAPPVRRGGVRERGAGRDRWVDADQSVTSAVLGDGGVYSTVLDLARWDAALCESVRRPPHPELAPYSAPVEPGVDAGAESGADGGVAYGYGWYLDRFRGHSRQRHDGWTSGFQNEMQRFPAAGLTVVVLTNRASPPVRPLVEAIAIRLLAPTG